MNPPGVIVTVAQGLGATLRTLEALGLVTQEGCVMASNWTARSRSYRQRRRCGKASIRIEVNLVDISEYLIEGDLLPAWSCDDRQAIGRGIAQLLDLLVEREKMQKF